MYVQGDLKLQGVGVGGEVGEAGDTSVYLKQPK